MPVGHRYGILRGMSDCVSDFIGAWQLMASRFPSPVLVEEDGVAVCFGNVPLIFLNLWVQSRPAGTPEELASLLAAGGRRAAACEYPAGGILREDWLPEGWEAQVDALGLEQMMRMTWMEAGLLAPPRRPAADLEIRRVESDAAAADLATLNALAYGMPEEAFACMASLQFWTSDSYAYVGYAEGKPVSCAAVLPVAGTVYVALVATAPGEQRKGYAETVMRHAVTQGQQAMGTTRTTLHASEMGQPVYQAMGFQAGPCVMLVGAAH